MRYSDSIVNKHRVIKIGKAKEYEDERLSLSNHLKAYPNGKFTELIRQAVGDLGYKDYAAHVAEREKRFEELLMSTWKMCLVDKDGKNETPIKYIFPYKYIHTNSYLFYLESIIYNNFYHINGLTESNSDITSDDFFAQGNLVFYEVDFNEMLEHSKSRCDEAAETRLARIIEANRKQITCNE